MQMDDANTESLPIDTTFVGPELDCECCGVPTHLCENTNTEDIPLALIAGW